MPRLWVLIFTWEWKINACSWLNIHLIYARRGRRDAIYSTSAMSMDGQSRAFKKAGWLQATIYLDGEYDLADNKDLLNIRADYLSHPLQNSRRHKPSSTIKWVLTWKNCDFGVNIYSPRRAISWISVQFCEHLLLRIIYYLRDFFHVKQ